MFTYKKRGALKRKKKRNEIIARIKKDKEIRRVVSRTVKKLKKRIKKSPNVFAHAENLLEQSRNGKATKKMAHAAVRELELVSRSCIEGLKECATAVYNIQKTSEAIYRHHEELASLRNSLLSLHKTEQKTLEYLQRFRNNGLL